MTNSTVPSVDVLHLAEDRDEVSPLIDELQRAGLTVHVREPDSEPPPDRANVLVLLLTTRLVEAVSEDRLKSAMEGYGDVVPVSYYSLQAPVLEDLTHSLLCQVGPGEAARRIAAIARFGGRRIVDWHTLVDRARAWRTTEDGQKLLGQNELTQALVLFQSLGTANAGPADEVRRFLDASSGTLERRRRRSLSVASITAVVMVVALVVASVQAVSARTAQDRADRANAISTADRLSRTAVTLKEGDPDLPSMLVERASSLASTDAVRTATVEVAASTWPHTSISLGFAPTMLTASAESKRVVVTSHSDLSIRVIDADTLAEVSRLDCCENSDDQPIRGFLDGSGERLAVASPGENRAFVVPADRPDQPGVAIESWKPDDVLLGWWNDSELLIGRAGAVLAVGIDSGRESAILSMPSETNIRAIGRSPDQRFLAVTNTDAIILFDTSSMTVVRIFEETEVTALAVNDAGDYIYGSRFPTGIAISVGEDPADDTVGESELTTVSGVSMGGDYMIAGARSQGMLALIGRGQSPLASVRAHRSDDVRIARLSDGRVISVAYDGFLRVWQAPDEARVGKPMPFGLSDQRATFASTAGVEISPLESSRNQVRFVDSERVTVSMLPGYTWILDAGVLEPPDRRNAFSGLNTESFFSRNGRILATVASKYVRIYEWDDAIEYWSAESKAEVVGTPPPMRVDGTGTGTASVSDSGQTITIADEYVVSNWSMDTGTTTAHTFSEPGSPIGLFSVDTGVSYALTANGQVRGSDGSEVPLSIKLESLSSPIVAAEVSSFDSFTIVTEDGRVLRADGTGGIAEFDVVQGVEPFAVRESSTGATVAVLGTKALTVLDSRTGAIRYQEAAIGKSYLTDIAIDDESGRAIGVSVIASVRGIDLDAPSLTVGAPRDPAPEETDSLLLETESSNG